MVSLSAMAKFATFMCLVIATSHFITLPTASGQSLDWVVLDENSENAEAAMHRQDLLAVSSNYTEPCNRTKDEKYCNCQYRVHLDPDEYAIVNSTAHVAAYNATYNHSFYEIEDERLVICAPDFLLPGKKSPPSGKYSPTLTYITIVGLSISMLCLLLHLVIFALVPDLRNLPGYSMACLCISLFAGYASFLVGFDEYIISSIGPCIATAASTHFFLLSSVLWMNVMAYDVLKSLLNATGKMIFTSKGFCFRNFYMYCLYAWGIAMAFTVLAVVADLVPDFPEGFRPLFGQGFCWFRQKNALLVFFAAPVFIVICLNVIFFGVSAHAIMSNRMKTDDVQRNLLKRSLVLYARLAVLMGLTWVTGLLAAIIDAVFLWYIFVILNTLQGFFIFLAFSCSPKARKHLSSKKFSTPTLTLPFRSDYSNGKYCSNATVVQKI